MRKTLAVLVMLCFTAIVSFAQNYVTLYENCNYSGRNQRLAPGNYRYYQLGIGNDKLSSMRVPGNLKVTIYEHDNYSGNSQTYYANTTCLPAEWNDKASSVVVERVQDQPDNNPKEDVTFYSDCSYRGITRTLKPGRYTGAQLGTLKYSIASFIISGNLQVRAYINNTELSGYHVNFEEDMQCLASAHRDRIGSLEILVRSDLPGSGTGGDQYVTMYSECQYGGNGLRLMPGYYRGDDLGILKYKASSIQVPTGMRVKAYLNNDNLTGSSYNISSDINCMSSSLRNRIGSLVIEETGSGTGSGNGNNQDRERVVIYEHEDYKGRSATLLPGMYSSMAQAGFLDNALSSLELPPGYRVVLYEHENFGGKSYTILRSKSKFYLSGWEDKTSSIAVYKE